jgi:Tn3 transposase DDE domain
LLNLDAGRSRRWWPPTTLLTATSCSTATVTRPRWARRSPSTGGSPKTLHLLAFVDPADEGYRRVVRRQLTIQESRHRLARKIFHGQRARCARPAGKARKTSSARGLVMNAVVLWNTRYTDAAVEHLRARGQEAAGEDSARLSPLADAHINMLGRYAFTTLPSAGLRPLRDRAYPDSTTDQVARLRDRDARGKLDGLTRFLAPLLPAPWYAPALGYVLRQAWGRRRRNCSTRSR